MLRVILFGMLVGKCLSEVQEMGSLANESPDYIMYTREMLSNEYSSARRLVLSMQYVFGTFLGLHYVPNEQSFRYMIHLNIHLPKNYFNSEEVATYLASFIH